MDLAVVANIATVVGVFLTFIGLVVSYVKTGDRLDSIEENIEIYSSLEQLNQNVSAMSNNVETVLDSETNSKNENNIMLNTPNWNPNKNDLEAGENNE